MGKILRKLEEILIVGGFLGIPALASIGTFLFLKPVTCTERCIAFLISIAVYILTFFLEILIINLLD